MAMCRRLVLGLVIFMLGEQPSWLNPTQGNWTVNSQRVAGNCKNVLLPFGPAAGDTTYPAGFDVGGNINPSFGPIALPSGVRLLNSGPYNNPYINAQGVISFEAPQASLVTNLPVVGTSTAMIMVNPMDLASSSIADGNIFYRVVEASDAVAMADVLEATAIAWDTYPVYPALEWAFIVTWSCVRRNGGADSERQTFQFVLTTDGITVATFHNFAEVNTPDDMLVGLQAGGAFAGDALSPSFFLNQYNACPCGRWALQVHDVFTMPMSGIKACPGDCSYDEPEGCVDCMDFTADDPVDSRSGGIEGLCRIGHPKDSDSADPANSDTAVEDSLRVYGFEGSEVVLDRKGRELIAESTTGNEDPCKFSLDMQVLTSKKRGISIAYFIFYFGIHSNSKKFRRNLKFDTDLVLLERGQGIGVGESSGADKQSLPYHYEASEDKGGPLTIDVVQNEDGNLVLTSSCPYSFVFDPVVMEMSFKVGEPFLDNTIGHCSAN